MLHAPVYRSIIIEL